MIQRGRKSAIASSVISKDWKQTQLQPPTTLSDVERKVFVDLVAACASDHFRSSDLPLLARYCEATVLAEQAARELRGGAVVDGRPSAWVTVQEKTIRALVALSMRLRLSPQSRIDPKTLGRQQPRIGPRPWEIGE